MAPRVVRERLLRGAVLACALLLIACNAEDDGDRFAYVVLGDSLGAGIGAEVPEEGGYAPLLLGRLSQDAGTPFLNLAWPGLTTGTMIGRGHLDDAVEALAEGVDGAPVGVVTLTIGGNDGALLFAPCEEGPTTACRAAAEEVLDGFEENFTEILRAVVEAAPDDARILAVAYYNPLLHPDCRFHEQADLADEVLEGGAALDLDGGLNDRLRQAAEQQDVGVVETFGMLEAEHLRDDCLHPNDAGHAMLADRFEEALEQ